MHFMISNINILPAKPGYISLFLICISLIIYSSPLDKSDIIMKIENIGPVINTKGDEFFPTITADGKTMVFSLRTKGRTSSTIYKSSYTEDGWNKPEVFDILNSDGDDQTPYINPDGDIIVFSSNRKGSLIPIRKPGQKYFITNDLYISRFSNGKWTEPVSIPGDVNTIENERAPSLSRDKKTLYFSRYEGDDIEKSIIMQATLYGDSYTDVKPLPFPVNSGNSDFGLMPSNNKPGFYFSSNRPGGYGLWDIYFVHYKDKDGIFSNVTNLGAEVNSTTNELSITEIGENKIYFCSDREGGFGGSDIYSITLSPVIFKVPDTPDTGLIFKIIESGTNRPIKLALKLGIKYKNEPGPIETVISGSDSEGILNIIAKPGGKTVIVKPADDSIKNFENEIKLEEGKMKPVLIEVVLKRVTPLQFKPVYFDYGSADIHVEDMAYLQGIITFLMKNKNIRIDIIGHTDRFGHEEKNDRLSLRRAMNVFKYFMSFNLDGKRFNITGKGTQNPATTFTDKKSERLNRRVELKVFE
jgi:outer membrane protein OmpA-like peptidoglycan-associated protein